MSQTRPIIEQELRNSLRLQIKRALAKAWESASTLKRIEDRYGPEIIEELIALDPVLRELMEQIRELTQ